MKNNKQDVIQFLEEFANLLELEGANPFKIRAFVSAARSLETMSESFEEVFLQKRLTDIKGIGKGIAADIEAFCLQGKVEAHEELKAKVPESLFELFKVPSLGPKKIKILWKDLKIESLSDLEYACQENRLLKLKGFGEKTQNKIMEGIGFLKKNIGKFRYQDALQLVDPLLQYLTKSKYFDQLQIAGSLRRKKEIVSDVDILCVSKKATKAIEYLCQFEGIEKILAQGETKSSIVLKVGLQVDVRVVQEEEFATALAYFTGSKEHNTNLRSIAKKMGYKLNEYGLWDSKEKRIAIETEEALYQALGMDWVAPEMREGLAEVALAQKKQLPVLVQNKDIRGYFHFHTTASDGKNTLEEMIQKSIALGYEYIGVSDHSQSAFYAHGLKKEDIEKQHKEIDQMQMKYPQIKIFKGIESDILKDGSLDYPNAILKQFDFVIASVHSSFKMSKKEMTDRCIKALENPYTTMLGHPTGRLLLGRDGFEIDMEKIMTVAAKLGKIIELNASPYRLDLDWRLLPSLIKKKGMISINPDAHSIDGIEAISNGVDMARKGGVEKKWVFNTLKGTEVEKKLKEIRTHSF